MKYVIRSSLVSVLIILFAAQAPEAGAGVYLDDITPGYGTDYVLAGCANRFTFRLEYTGFFPTRLIAFSNGFHVWTHQGGFYTNQFSPIQYDTLSHDWLTRFDLSFHMSAYGVDGIGADTIGFNGVQLMGPGIFEDFIEPVWWIQTIPYQHGDTLCIDSTYLTAGGAWTWSLDQPPHVITPAWGGPYCFEATMLPCGPPEFVDCPGPIVAYPNVAIVDTFTATDPIGVPGEPFEFAHLWGPGTIQKIGDSLVVWSYTPTLDEVCEQHQVAIQVFRECNCAQCVFEVFVASGDIGFVSGCDDTAEIWAGESASLQVTPKEDECAPTELYIGTTNQPPHGAYSLTPGGLLTFDSDTLDRGHVTFDICITNDLDTACCPVSFFVRDTFCKNRGNVDGVTGPGGPVDVGDLSYLVNYLFRGGPPPACMEEGNVDATVGPGGPVDVGDVTYLVGWLWNGYYIPPCP